LKPKGYYAQNLKSIHAQYQEIMQRIFTIQTSQHNKDFLIEVAMNQAAQKKQIVQFPEVIFEAPKFQVSAFGLAHRVIKTMRENGIPDRFIEQYKENVHGLNLEDTMTVTMYTVTVIE